MPTSRKVGLAALFMIAITDVIFDIIRTVYTVNGGSVAPNTIWDIIEPTIAVIVSSLPTYKALLGPTKKRKNRSYQNLAHSGAVIWKGTRSQNAKEWNDIELDIESGQASKKTWGHGISKGSGDAMEMTNVV